MSMSLPISPYRFVCLFQMSSFFVFSVSAFSFCFFSAGGSHTFRHANESNSSFSRSERLSHNNIDLHLHPSSFSLLVLWQADLHSVSFKVLFPLRNTRVERLIILCRNRFLCSNLFSCSLIVASSIVSCYASFPFFQSQDFVRFIHCFLLR